MMDLKILLGLLWPFVKEALFGRRLDKNNRKKERKPIAMRVTDFFMKSHRATSILILISIISVFVNVMSIKKLTQLALSRPTDQVHDRAADSKEPVIQKPDKHGQELLEPQDTTEQSRLEIIESLRRRSVVIER